MKLTKLIDKLEIEFPSDSAWSGDNIGLLVGTDRQDIKQIFLTLELDDKALNQALEINADLIITFHPLIFNPIKRIGTEDRVSQLLRKLIYNNVGLYCIHTNLDAHPNGTNKYLSDKLGLEIVDFLEKSEQYENRGMGLIVKSNQKITKRDLVDRISKVCNSPVKTTDISNSHLERIAIVAGSGSNYIESAYEKGCDAIITSDVKYHDFHGAKNRIDIFDPGHYEMEQFVIESLYENLNDIFNNELTLIKCTSLTNPVKYYPEENYLEKQKQNLKK